MASRSMGKAVTKSIAAIYSCASMASTGAIRESTGVALRVASSTAFRAECLLLCDRVGALQHAQVRSRPPARVSEVPGCLLVQQQVCAGWSLARERRTLRENAYRTDRVLVGIVQLARLERLHVPGAARNPACHTAPLGSARGVNAR